MLAAVASYVSRRLASSCLSNPVSPTGFASSQFPCPWLLHFKARGEATTRVHGGTRLSPDVQG